MAEPSAFRLSDVIGALSFALDMTDGQPEGHSLRSCVIGMRLARELDLPPSDQAAAFYGLLMKDAGCSSNAAAVAALYGIDEIEAKRSLRTVNYSRPAEALGYIVRNVAGPRNLVRVLRSASASARAMTEIRCERGAAIAEMLALPEGAAAAIASLGEHWDGSGHPVGLRGEEIPLLARLFKLAQTVEVFVRDFGLEAARAMAVARSGSWFDPRLVETFLELESDTAFWTALARADAATLGGLEPMQEIQVADDARLDSVASAFALVIDAKSPFTYCHSSRVAELAVRAARQAALPAAALPGLRRAGLLHDIGKLTVPNVILDKPGPLTDAERKRVEQHPALSEQILGRVPVFAGVARLAGAHHEKLDGSGYPNGKTARELTPQDRILAVADVYEALTSERPYRAALSHRAALAILEDEAAAGKLCGDAVAALADALRVDATLAA